MRFNPYGNEDMGTDIDSGGRQKGFSHGLIEGMLVRRGIDRQNKFDKLNEQHNTKLMEMQEQDSRDRVLHAALTADKMRIDNEFAPEVNQSKIADMAADTKYKGVQTDLAPKEFLVRQQNANTSASNVAWDRDLKNNPRNVKLQQEVDDTNATNKWARGETGDPNTTAASYTLANKIIKDKASIKIQKARVDAINMKQAAMGIKDAAKQAQADKAGYDKALDTLNGMKKAMDNDKNLVHSVEEINGQALFIANNWPDLVEAKTNAPGTNEEEVILVPKSKTGGTALGTVQERGGKKYKKVDGGWEEL
jgi:hypothetical protein